MTIALLWLDIVLPILGIIVPVFATVYTVTIRLKNQNRENHQPYLVLKRVDDVKKVDEYQYYLTIIGRNYKLVNNLTNEQFISDLKHDNDIDIKLILRNIGYGVATNIRFYNLLTGRAIIGTQQSNKQQNQKLFTTFDIASSEEKEMQGRIISAIIENDGIFVEDHNRILCVYKDLNQNVYNFIISINVKPNQLYDFFAYQPSSKSYKNWIKENQKQYKQILKDYRLL